MNRFRFEVRLAAVLLGLFLVVFLWQTPSLWQRGLSPAEIDGYAAEIDERFVLRADEKADFIARLRVWAAADDGASVMMLNLMRFHDTLRALPEGAAFSGTPVEANAIYEEVVAPLALKRGEYPLITGRVQGANLVGGTPGLDPWDRVVVMRAPSRRAFLEFMADPAYGRVAAYKSAAAHVMLVPVTPDLVLPDVRFIAGSALLTLYFFICWIRRLRGAPAGAAATTDRVSNDGAP
jgi:uncharacterized protein (DUF1330 family)